MKALVHTEIASDAPTESVPGVTEAQLLDRIADLSRSNEELKSFACIAAHDLQEPLRMVSHSMELISTRYKGKLDSDADEFIALAVDGASRMQGLIRDLLAYASAGTKEPDISDASGEEALQLALINLRSAVAESRATVTHDPLPTVQADPAQLVQLFQNLIGNALKYQGPGVPWVHVSAAEMGGGKAGTEKWMFSIQDNGLGIDPRNFEKIFGAFQRLHKQGDIAGSGLGLAICKRIAERHGTEISVESRPGQGSTFRFALAGSGKKGSCPRA